MKCPGNTAAVFTSSLSQSYGAVGLLGAAVFSMGAALVDGQISADELELSHPHMHWEFEKMTKSYDHKA